MHLQNRQRRIKDTLLISAWVFGYEALIATFAVLQRLEKRFERSARDEGRRK